jgi:hypothetical protein
MVHVGVDLHERAAQVAIMGRDLTPHRLEK